MIRNLLYNCCAFDWNQEWWLNAETLNRYAEVFTGRRLIIVRTGPGLVPFDEVRTAFSFEAEFIPLPNDPVLHEVSGFLDVLGRLESKDPNEATFYAHTKGVSRRKEDLDLVRRWRDIMYEQCLSDPTKIDQVLATHACCGCFRAYGGWTPFLHRPSEWHYRGTFWWVRHSALFSADWRTIPASFGRYGVEMYLGCLFPVSRSYCLYGDNSQIHKLR